MWSRVGPAATKDGTMAKSTPKTCPHCGANESEWMSQSDEANGVPAVYVCECDARIFVSGDTVVDSVSASAYHSAQADYSAQMQGCDREWA